MRFPFQMHTDVNQNFSPYDLLPEVGCISGHLKPSLLGSGVGWFTAFGNIQFPLGFGPFLLNSLPFCS